MIRHWQGFATQYGTILAAPIFGAHYDDFRERGGAADHLTELVQQIAAHHLPGRDGPFALHGHSAGGQFACRYLVTHPDRLTDAVISAPSEYAFPDPAVPWPHGTAGLPETADWIAAATQVRVTVLVGTADLDPRPIAPGHAGATRLERAEAWVTAMRQCAVDNRLHPRINLRQVEGVHHDESSMNRAAQHLLADRWRRSAVLRHPDASVA